MTTTAEDTNTPPFDWNGYMVQRRLDSEEWEDFLYEPVQDLQTALQLVERYSAAWPAIFRLIKRETTVVKITPVTVAEELCK